MQWFKTRLAFVVAFFLLVSAFLPETVSANAPDVYGRVRTINGTPMSNIVVRWKDDEDNRRYAITNSDGVFAFPSWHWPLPSGNSYEDEFRDVRIDTNYDGTLDENIYRLHDPDSAFGCEENPHQFLVLRNPNIPGYFQQETIELTRDNPLPNAPRTYDIGEFIFVPETPPCPQNPRMTSCNQSSGEAVVAWDPVDGASSYNLKFDRYQFDDNNAGGGDFDRTSSSNQLSISTTPGALYRFSAQTVKVSGSNTFTSEFCHAEFSCGTASCDQPTGTFTNTYSCTPNASSPTGDTYSANFSLSNINLDGAQFGYTEFMVNFEYNEATTKKIIDEFGEPNFSQWVTENRPNRRNGDWFLYTIKKFESLPAASTQLDHTMPDSNQFGNATVREFRQFLDKPENSDLSKFYRVSANIFSMCSTSPKFTPYIPANVTTSFAMCYSGGTDDFQCNDLCTTDAECRTTNSEYSCVSTSDGNRCRLKGDEEQIDCKPNPDNEIECVQPPEVNIPAQILDQTSTTVTIGVNADQPLTYNLIAYNFSRYSGNDAQVQQIVQAYQNGTRLSLPPDIVLKTNLNTSSVVITIPTEAPQLLTDTSKIRVIVQAATSASSTDPNFCDWNVRQDVDIPFEVTGRYCLKTDDLCSQCTQVIEIAGAQVQAKPVGTNNWSSDNVAFNNSEYTANLLPYDDGYNLRLLLPDTNDYVCADCNYDDSKTCQSPTEVTEDDTVDFFVTPRASLFSSWWQSRGGLVYSQTETKSQVPLVDGQPSEECDALGNQCSPFLVREGSLGNFRTAGIPIASNFNNWLNGYWSENGNKRVVPSYSSPSVENFAYFKSLIRDVLTVVTKVSGTEYTSSPGDLFTGQSIGGATVRYIRVDGNGTINIKPSTTWTVNSGQKHIVFIEGNLHLAKNGPTKLITVNPGGYLMFIVSGNITIDESVGYDYLGDGTVNLSLDPNLEGIYVADGTLTVERNEGGHDKKLVGAGTFVGWTNVFMNRLFDDPRITTPEDEEFKIRNSYAATENFIFRPDFMVNAPEAIMVTNYTWKEVN